MISTMMTGLISASQSPLLTSMLLSLVYWLTLQPILVLADVIGVTLDIERMGALFVFVFVLF